ncbi:MAG: DUF5691 domain-containing protein, partial [Bacteroidota bacterium]
MPSWYDQLLSTLTLGTARKDLRRSLADWLEAKEAMDPTNPLSTEEQLLTTWAITERQMRLKPGVQVGGNELVALVETRAYPSPKMARALDLILRGTYPQVLEEALTVLEQRNQLFPPHLLPAVVAEALQRLDEAPALAARLVAAGGERMAWLVQQNPEWAVLSSSFDLAKAWEREVMPSKRTALLRRWRSIDPVASRKALDKVWTQQSPKNQETLVQALKEGIGPEDQAWLRAQLGPKRKGVRRVLLRLLLLSGEPAALEGLIEVATAAFDERGNFVTILRDDAAKEVLGTYGGINRGEDIGAYLLQMLPPAVLPELTDRSFMEFWSSLTKAKLQAAAQAVYDYPDLAAKKAIVRFALRANPTQLPVDQIAKITANLPQEDFLEVFH